MSGCQLFCNPDGSANGFATFLTYAFVVLIVAGGVWAVIAYVVTSLTGGRGARRGPVVPGSVARGRQRGYGSRQVYVGQVDAVTPRGTRTRRPCCQRGHLTPDGAAEHAAAIGARIARLGQ